MDFDKSEFLNRLAFCIEHSNINKMAGISNVNDLGFTKEQYDYIVYLTSYTAMYAIDEYNNMIKDQFPKLIDSRIEKYIGSNFQEN